MLRPQNTTPFYGRQPGEKAHWSGEAFPKDCLLEQVVEHAAIQNINAFIEAGLATAGTNQK